MHDTHARRAVGARAGTAVRNAICSVWRPGIAQATSFSEAVYGQRRSDHFRGRGEAIRVEAETTKIPMDTLVIEHIVRVPNVNQ